MRLSRDLRAGRITERPVDTVNRYIRHTQRGITVTLTAPADRSVVGATTTVVGTTAPGSTVDVLAVSTDGDAAGTTATATGTAGTDGRFSIPVAVPRGTVVITVTATAPGGATGFAQRTVANDIVAGTLLFGVDDPSGDDNGPGTFQYPTAADFKAGAYDLQRFEVYDTGDTVTFRVRTADLTPTFGSPLGAQLVDVYVRNPADGPTSTAASFPQRNYRIAADSAWNRLIEVQGFGQRFIDAAGATVGSVDISASAITRYITFRVSKAALGGRRRPGGPSLSSCTARTGSAPTRPVASRRRRGTSSSASARRPRSTRATRSARSTRGRCPRRWTCSPRPASRRPTSSTRRSTTRS